jgi:hypothetical protein
MESKFLSVKEGKKAAGVALEFNRESRHIGIRVLGFVEQTPSDQLLANGPVVRATGGAQELRGIGSGPPESFLDLVGVHRSHACIIH